MTDVLVDTLEEQVRQLRTELGLEPERETINRFRAAFGLTSSEATILAVLHRAGSAWVTRERLDMALPDRDDPRDIHTVAVHICNLRKKVGADAIIGMFGAGYTLGAPGVQACRRALADLPLFAGDAA